MRGNLLSPCALVLIKFRLGSSLRFAFSVVGACAISLVLFSEALPSTRYFDHRDPHVEVSHDTCELEASFRVSAVMFGVHCLDPLPDLDLKHG